MWVRNRVVESMRWSAAQLGTWKGAMVKDVGPDSVWINGYRWMSGDEKDFLLKAFDEIILSSEEITASNKEKIFEDLPVPSHQCRPSGK